MVCTNCIGFRSGVLAGFGRVSDSTFALHNLYLSGLEGLEFRAWGLGF